MSHRHFLVTLLLIYILQFLAFLPQQLQTDSPTFANAIALWAGEEVAEDRLMRCSKPLALLLPLLLYKLGFAAITALVIQQHLAFWAALFLLYKIAFRLSASVNITQLFCILYAGAAPSGLYGLAALVDMSGWATALSLTYLGLYLLQTQQLNFLSAFSLGVALAAGFFIKENVATSCIFLFFLLILDKNLTLKSKFFYALCTLFSFFVILTFGLWLTRFYFGYNLISWFQFNNQNKIIYNFPLLSFATQTFRSLDNSFILVTFGIYFYVKKYVFLRKINSAEFSFLLTGLVGLAVFPFAWAYYMDRIIFMFAPFLLYFAAFFLTFFNKKGFFLAILTAFCNIIANFVVYNFPITYFLSFSYFIFIIIVFIFLYKNQIYVRNGCFNVGFQPNRNNDTSF